MKNTALLTLIICSFFTLSTLQAQDTNGALSKAKQAVDAFFAYDAQAYGEAFATDGWMVNPYGMRVDSRVGIINSHQWLFDQWKEQHGTYTIEAESAEALPGGAVVVSLQVDGTHHHDTGEVASKMSVVVMVVLTSRDQNWEINQLQLTPVVNPQQG